MPFVTTCPGCEKRLKVPDEARGKRLRCPNCKTSFTLPEEEPPAPPVEPDPFELATGQLPAGEAASPYPSPSQPEAAPAPTPRPAPAPVRPSPPADAWSYARAAGIDMNEQHYEGVTNGAQANLKAAEWKQDFPPVKSAYQPSGILPAAAVVWMAVGAVLGVPAGLLAGGLVGVVAAIVVGIIVGVIYLIGMACGFVLCILPIIGVIVGLAGFALTFAAQGGLSAVCTTSMGRLGKNRNATAAAVMSIISAALGLIVVGVALAAGGAEEVGEQARQHVAAEGENPPPAQAAQEKETPPGVYVAWAVFVVGGIISLAVAGVGGAQMVHEAKFCEDCEAYMEEKPLVGLRVGGVRALARAMRERNVPVCADLMNAPRGGNGTSKLFCCGRCGQGFVELTASFKATWQEKDQKKEKTETWLAGSVALTPDEVELFRPHAGKA